MPPVDDHPVHELTKIEAGKSYGCHNRTKYGAGYYAPNRAYRPDGTIYVIQEYIPHTMSTACRYDLSQTDPRCEGCTSEKDIKYIDR